MYHNAVFSEYKESDQVLLSKELFEWYCKNNQDKAIIMWNQEGLLTYVSKHFYDYMDQPPQDVIGREWTTIFSEVTTERIIEHFSKKTTRFSLAKGHINLDDTYENVFDIMVDYVKLNGNKTYICLLKNTTYIRELEDMVVNSEKLVLAAQFSAGLVHEIRNPLTSLKGFLQLVQSGVKQRDEYYQVMIGEIDKLEKITTELLLMSKPFSSEMKWEYVHELMEDVSFIMNRKTNFKDVNLNIICDEDIMITCNASQIKQVLINLVLNGAEAMNEQGTICIHAYKLDQSVIIDIIDEGEGVAAEVLREIQQPFFTTKEQGTGLGLVITQHLLDLHEAKLEVKSNEHRGSTFTISLPITLNNN